MSELCNVEELKAKNVDLQLKNSELQLQYVLIFLNN